MRWLRGIIATVVLGGSILSLFPVRVLAFGGGSGTSGSPYQVVTCADAQNITNNHYYIFVSDIDCSGQVFTPVTSASNVSIDGQGHALKGVHVAAAPSDYAGWFKDLTDSTVKNLRIMDTVMSSDQIVGAIAASGGNNIVQDVSVDGALTGSGYRVGMFFGETVNTTLQRVAAHGSLNTDADYSGGLVGLFHGTITDSFSDVAISGQGVVGGLIGFLYGPDGSPGYTGAATISRSYGAGSIENGVGGVSAAIVATMAHDSSINDSVGLTTMIGSASRFGIVGGSSSTATTPLSNNFYDKALTGATNCGGVSGCSGVDADGSDGLHFYDTSTAAPLSVWDFSSVWRTRINRPPALRSLPTTPDYPALIWIDPPTASTLTIHWADGDNGGSPITGYQVQYGESGGSLTTVNTTSRTVELTGLKPSTQYVFQMRAQNAYGWAPWRGAYTFTAAQAAGASATTSSQNLVIGKGGIESLPAVSAEAAVASDETTKTSSESAKTTSVDAVPDAAADVSDSTQQNTIKQGSNPLITLAVVAGALVLLGFVVIFVASRFKGK